MLLSRPHIRIEWIYYSPFHIVSLSQMQHCIEVNPRSRPVMVGLANQEFWQQRNQNPFQFRPYYTESPRHGLKYLGLYSGMFRCCTVHVQIRSVKTELHRISNVPRTGGEDVKLAVCSGIVQVGPKVEYAATFKETIASMNNLLKIAGIS